MKLLTCLTRYLLLFTLLSIPLINVQAHELRPTVADIELASDNLTISIRTNLEALISEIGGEHMDSDNAPQAERYEQLRRLTPDELVAEFQNYLPTFLQGITLASSDDANVSLPLRLGSLDIPPVGDLRLPRDSVLVFESPADNAPSSITWYWEPRYGAIILRDSIDDTDDRAFSQYLLPGERSDPMPLTPGAIQNGGSGFLDYVIIGFEHIIPKGLDHILFVIGLFLLAPKLKPILWQVSMFTVAHTATLALGITGVIALPPSIVEPLIALSITVVCVENLFGSRFSTVRLVMVFGFGLLHGLGFAGVLSEIGLVSGRFASSLVAFNIGVELGQLTVVLMCFALVGWWFGKKPWYRQRVSIPASLMVGFVGLYWFLQRVHMMG